MPKSICAFVAAALLIVAAPSFADDSSAALGAGGIVLVKNTPVRMAAEDLYVGPKAVRIRFTFVNERTRTSRPSSPSRCPISTRPNSGAAVSERSPTIR